MNESMTQKNMTTQGFAPVELMEKAAVDAEVTVVKIDRENSRVVLDLNIDDDRDADEVAVTFHDQPGEVAANDGKPFFFLSDGRAEELIQVEGAHMRLVNLLTDWKQSF